jgi:ATP-dependent Lon protease
LPKQIAAHGIDKNDIQIDKKLWQQIIESYTFESGVRGLDKIVAKLVRNRARQIAMEEAFEAKLSTDELFSFLGAGRSRTKYDNNEVAGVVTGLAWTAAGGDILFIESLISNGNGKLSLTGNLGEVMKESAVIALEYLKSHHDLLDIDPEIFAYHNVHVHVPEGATPKDGPSAGVTMLTALASLFTQRKVKKNLAMTGEITLRGDVLPVGGIKEKILAAKRAGITELILCGKNKQDVDEIAPIYLKGLKINYVEKMSEVLALALLKEKVKDAKTLRVPEKK